MSGSGRAAADAGAIAPRHQPAFACPRCREALAFEEASATCRSCRETYRLHDGFLDLAPHVTTPASYGQAVMESPMHASIYESTIRPHFVRLMARLWTVPFAEGNEHEYIRRYLDPVEGPVVDVACGTGRWTQTVAEKVGAERTIGLDLSVAMMKIARRACPDLLFVRGSARSLPFADAALGAINCWAALQLVPDPPAALREVARCLRPGGTFTCFTFRRSPDPVYRYFQRTHAPDLPLFEDEDILEWTRDSGMEVLDLSGPELALLFTARRKGKR